MAGFHSFFIDAISIFMEKLLSSFSQCGLFISKTDIVPVTASCEQMSRLPIALTVVGKISLFDTFK